MTRRSLFRILGALGASLPFARASISPSPLDFITLTPIRTGVGRYVVTLPGPAVSDWRITLVTADGASVELGGMPAERLP